MSEEEVLKIIDKVARKLAYKFRFGYHDIDDMLQQARLHAIQGLDRYDGERSLENFLWTHVRNRLFNDKRNKFERPDKPCFNCPFDAYIEKDGTCEKYADMEECNLYAGWVRRNFSKKNLMRPIGMDTVNDEKENNMSQGEDMLDLIGHKEIVDLLDANMPMHLRHQWLRLLNGAKIPKVQRLKIQEEVLKIFEENNIDVEETW